jgi:hypothetical protein
MSYIAYGMIGAGLTIKITALVYGLLGIVRSLFSNLK